MFLREKHLPKVFVSCQWMNWKHPIPWCREAANSSQIMLQKITLFPVLFLRIRHLKETKVFYAFFPAYCRQKPTQVTPINMHCVFFWQIRKRICLNSFLVNKLWVLGSFCFLTSCVDSCYVHSKILWNQLLSFHFGIGKWYEEIK